MTKIYDTISGVETEKVSSGRASGGVGASTLEAHGVGGNPETAEKVRRSVETLGAASRGESLKAHDTTRVGGDRIPTASALGVCQKTMARDADIQAGTREQLQRALLIGCRDWAEYAQAGYALYHADAIAQRIHAPASMQTEVDCLRKAFERIADAIAIPATNAA